MESGMKNLLVALVCTLLCVSGAARGVKQYTVQVIKEYPHDKEAYTQGLFFYDGVLYESTGLHGGSSLRKVDLATGKVLEKKNLNRKYFGEGSCVVGGQLYMLTWMENVAFIFDPATLEYRRTLPYRREGWGLAALPEAEGKAVMVASDGSSNLYWLDENLNTVKTVKVTLGERPLRFLNELEFIDGKIWANVYTTDNIAIIDPGTGAVTGIVDCSGLIPSDRRTPDMDVLNGIAQAPDGSIVLTGKNWPRVFAVKLVEVK